MYVQSELLQELVNVLDTKPDFHSAKFWLAVFQVKNVRAFAKVGKKERWLKDDLYVSMRTLAQ